MQKLVNTLLSFAQFSWRSEYIACYQAWLDTFRYHISLQIQMHYASFVHTTVIDYIMLLQIQIINIRINECPLQLGYIFQKKNKWGACWRTWNFQRYWRNSKCNFQELNMEFPRVTKKKSCAISKGLGFDLTFYRILKVLISRISRVEAFVWNFLG